MIKKSTSIILYIAALATFFVAVISLDYSALSISYIVGAAVFIAGVLSPYGYALIVNRMLSQPSTILILHIVTTFFSVTGVFAIFYAQFIQRDAQSAMALVVIPIFQWLLLIPLSLVLFVLHKYSRSHTSNNSTSNN